MIQGDAIYKVIAIQQKLMDKTSLIKEISFCYINKAVL
jgi:hypothetical protein